MAVRQCCLILPNVNSIFSEWSFGRKTSFTWPFCWFYRHFHCFFLPPLQGGCFVAMPAHKLCTPKFSCGLNAVSKAIVWHVFVLTKPPCPGVSSGSRQASISSGL